MKLELSFGTVTENSYLKVSAKMTTLELEWKEWEKREHTAPGGGGGGRSSYLGKERMLLIWLQYSGMILTQGERGVKNGCVRPCDLWYAGVRSGQPVRRVQSSHAVTMATRSRVYRAPTTNERRLRESAAGFTTPQCCETLALAERGDGKKLFNCSSQLHSRRV